MMLRRGRGTTGPVDGHLVADHLLSFVSAVLPFVPNRTSTAFARGLMTSAATSSSTPTEPRNRQVRLTRRSSVSATMNDLVVCSPAPRAMRAAVLVVDVSGFTALSEDARRRAGSAGAERFSVALSAFFGKMTELTTQFGGDVDCFAGDALSVVFECGSSGASTPTDENKPSFDPRHGSHEENTLHSASRAFLCAREIHHQLHGFRNEPDDPPLLIHSALAVGDLHYIECGSAVAQRSEALVVGQPLIELGEALSLSKQGEIALAPSAQRTMNTQLSVINFDELQDTHVAGVLELYGSASMERIPSTLKNILCKDETERDVAQHAAQIVGVLARKSRLLGPSAYPKPEQTQFTESPVLTAESSGDTFSSLNSESMVSTQQSKTPPHLMGMEALLRFVPRFVRSKLSDPAGLESLTEHRTVTVLFAMASLEEHAARFGDPTWLVGLQKAVGSGIDLVEGELGGTTRQVTVDDKGLAMIFVFGLPGFRLHSQHVPAVRAGLKLVALMRNAGIATTAGVSSGSCFCGIIGNPKIRCEYAVMGDVVNTGARVAAAARRQGERLLCTDVVASHAKKDLATHGLKPQPTGYIKLKGKQNEAQLFAVRPAGLGLQRQSASLSQVHKPPCSSTTVGREVELDAIRALLRAEADTAQPRQLRIAIVEGPAGMGKTAVVEQITLEALLGNSPVSGFQWVHVKGSDNSSAHFLICRNILKCLLELDETVSSEAADEVSWLLGDFPLVSASLPAAMRPYAAQLGELQTDPQALRLHDLYTSIIWDILQSTRVMLMLGDVHLLDAASVAVLGALAERAASGAPPPHPAATSVIIATSRNPIAFLPEGHPSNSPMLLHDLPGVLRLQLPPLADDAVERLSVEALGCDSLAPAVRSTILRHSQGMPLYVIELCHWLENEGLVVEGHLSGAAADLDLETIVPPSLQNLVQLVIDHLPPGLATLLRYASVLGRQFDEAMLLHLLPPGVSHSTHELTLQLRALEEISIVSRCIMLPLREAQPPGDGSAGGRAQTARSHANGRASMSLDGGPRDVTWQFNNLLHYQVVYGTMSHASRRALHRQAAAWLKEQADTPGIPAARTQRLLMAQARHWEKALEDGLGAPKHHDSGSTAAQELAEVRRRLDAFSN
eukprot:jgi/Tetstr1/464805/TSEL_009544.t1